MEPKLLAQIKAQLRRHMNGTTAHIMRGMDNAYAANYGLSLQHARDVAALFALTPDECDELWLTRWRDLMLIAAAALTPQRADVDRMMRWAQSIPSQEMVEHLAFLLAGRAACAADLVQALLHRASGCDIAFAAHTTARALALNTDCSSPLGWGPIADSVLVIALRTTNPTATEASAFSFLCRQCVRHNIATVSAANLAEAAEVSPSACLRRLAADYYAEIEFFAIPKKN